MIRAMFSHPIMATVRSTITRNNMIPEDCGLVVGVSGGPDSVALLHLLHAMQWELPFRMVVAHLDHCLRTESSQEARFVADVCHRLGVLSISDQADVRELAEGWGVSIEEAGRRARYDFFEAVRLSEGAEVIATAHHKDDSLETFFLRILRGSSLSGLGGIPPVRGKVVRPLMEVDRAEIMDFLAQERISYLIDPTNLRADTDRNFIRNRILPVIEERFPDFKAPLGRTVDLIGQDQDFLDRLAEELYVRAVRETGSGLQLELPLLAGASAVLSSRVIVKALYALSGPHVRWSRKHVDSIVGIATSDNPSGTIDLPAEITAHREYDILNLSPGMSRESTAPFRYVVSGPGTIEIPEARLTLSFRVFRKGAGIPSDMGSSSKVYFDAHGLPFPFVLRPPQPGDRLRPWGMEGTRKIKDVLIDAKVPVRKRQRIVILASGDEILWVVGHRRGAGAPVLDQTGWVLEVSIV